MDIKPIGINARQVFIPKDMPVEWQAKVADLYSSSLGLTKREYFAAMAMNCLQAEYDTNDIDPKSIAKKAIKLADALIAELNK